MDSINITNLGDLNLIDILNRLPDFDRKNSQLVCRLFQSLIENMRTADGATMSLSAICQAIGTSRLSQIDAFLGQTVPGLAVTYNKVFETLHQRGIETYIGGGMVRDLLSRQSNPIDVDFSFTGDVEEIVEIAKENHWLFSKRPDFPVIIIGNRKECCLQGISADFTVSAPMQSLEFCLNAVFYDCKNKKLIDPSSKGLEDIVRKRLNIPIEDKQLWLYGDEFGSQYNKIFRFWKLVGRRFTADKPLRDFIISQTKMTLENDKSQFLEDLSYYLGRDYEDLKSFETGCELTMGRNWKEQILDQLKEKIEEYYNKKEQIWNSFTSANLL